MFPIALTTSVVVLTEVASNTAIGAALLPIAATIAASSGIDIAVISAAVAVSKSCAFMLPVATPPITLVFDSGHVTAAHMMRGPDHERSIRGAGGRLSLRIDAMLMWFYDTGFSWCVKNSIPNLIETLPSTLSGAAAQQLCGSTISSAPN